MLYLVTTPIGNLGDLSKRALETLEKVDSILCEDTRRSGLLLSKLCIKKPLESYHKFSEAKKEASLISQLHEGKKIALVSDSGCPTICDPGQRLVAACHSEGIEVRALPGPSAPITALSLSGFPALPFTFWGFLEKKPGDKQTQLTQALLTPGTSLFFDSPARIRKSLELLCELAPEREVFVAREMTKLHETHYRGKAMEVLNALPKDVLGEITFAIAPGSSKDGWHLLSAEKLTSWLETGLNLSPKEAIKCCAELLNKPKSEIYNKIIKNNDFN
jgi:16S rRNA (cytidine1402-2'-O)-methyltransferase